jgi:hypothetical protein
VVVEDFEGDRVVVLLHERSISVRKLPRDEEAMPDAHPRCSSRS